MTKALRQLGTSEIPAELRKRFGIKTTRWQIYRLVADGRVPASRGPRGDIRVAETELPAIAALVGGADQDGQLPPAA